jgi:hypothetical protein
LRIGGLELLLGIGELTFQARLGGGERIHRGLGVFELLARLLEVDAELADLPVQLALASGILRFTLGEVF